MKGNLSLFKKDAMLDVRNIPVEGLLDNSVSNGSESFVHKKYTVGRPNGSLDATKKGFEKSLNAMLDNREPLFGSHIREIIHQWRVLFGSKT